jgi:hypothetical protein
MARLIAEGNQKFVGNYANSTLIIPTDYGWSTRAASDLILQAFLTSLLNMAIRPFQSTL